MTIGHSVLVLHDPADSSGGAPWPPAIATHAVVAPDMVLAPDLPGCGAADSALSQQADIATPAFAALDAIAEAFGSERSSVRFDTVIGIGASGWSAIILALADRADHLVLVDALGGPFLEFEAAQQRRDDGLRRKAAAAAAGSSLSAGELIVGPFRADTVRRGLESLQADRTVAITVVETPSSPLSTAEVTSVTEGIGVRLLTASSTAPADVVAALAAGIA